MSVGPGRRPGAGELGGQGEPSLRPHGGGRPARRRGLIVVLGYRSDAEQAKLFARPPRPRVGRPRGRSLHRLGIELDLGPPGGLRLAAPERPARRLHQRVLTDIRGPPERSDEGIPAARRRRGTDSDVAVVVLAQYAQPGYALSLPAFSAAAGPPCERISERIFRPIGVRVVRTRPARKESTPPDGPPRSTLDLERDLPDIATAEHRLVIAGHVHRDIRARTVRRRRQERRRLAGCPGSCTRSSEAAGSEDRARRQTRGWGTPERSRRDDHILGFEPALTAGDDVAVSVLRDRLDPSPAADRQLEPGRVFLEVVRRLALRRGSSKRAPGRACPAPVEAGGLERRRESQCPRQLSPTRWFASTIRERRSRLARWWPTESPDRRRR
jgi:hypothetical protein